MAYRLVFFGTSDFSVPSLQALLDDPRFEVVAVVTKPDAPIGRHQVLTPPPVKVLAAEHGVKIFQFEKIKTDETYQALAETPADAYVVVSYGKIIPQRILDLPKRGCINVHGSLLPKWRGASCIQAAISAGEEKSGITIMMMDAEMDHGDLLAQREVTITQGETGGQLHDRLAQLGAQALPDVLVDYLEGKITPRPQDHDQATYCKLLTREDGKIDWDKPAVEIERLVRAYDPWPTTWTEWQGKRIKIKKVGLTSESPADVPLHVGQPAFQNNRIFVPCGDGYPLEITELQPEGSKSMSAKDYTLGHHQQS